MASPSRNDGRKSTVLEQDSSVPRYHQLKEIIREQCASWEPGQLIPSELELCQMYSVSRTTVRKALDHLTQILQRVQPVLIDLKELEVTGQAGAVRIVPGGRGLPTLNPDRAILTG